MSTVFKSIGRGLLYIVLFPLLLLAIAIYAVYGVGVFIFQLGKLVYLFFTGRTLNSDLPEDIKVKALCAQAAPKEEPKPDQSYVVYSGGYTSPIEKEPVKKEEKVDEDGIIHLDEEEDL